MKRLRSTHYDMMDKVRKTGRSSYLVIRTLNRLVEAKLDELQLPKLYKTERLAIYEGRITKYN